VCFRYMGLWREITQMRSRFKIWSGVLQSEALRECNQGREMRAREKRDKRLKTAKSGNTEERGVES